MAAEVGASVANPAGNPSLLKKLNERPESFRPFYYLPGRLRDRGDKNGRRNVVSARLSAGPGMSWWDSADATEGMYQIHSE